MEERVNELILQGAKVEVTVYEEGDKKPEEARTRGLPDNHSGPIRVITIDGVDTNMCCGTHVNNLLHLQVWLNFMQVWPNFSSYDLIYVNF